MNPYSITHPGSHPGERDDRGDVEVEEEEEGHRRGEHRVQPEAVQVVVERVLPQPRRHHPRVRARPAHVQRETAVVALLRRSRVGAAAPLHPTLVGGLVLGSAAEAVVAAGQPRWVAVDRLAVVLRRVNVLKLGKVLQVSGHY